MNLSSHLSIDNIHDDCDASSQKQIFCCLSSRLSQQCSRDRTDILAALLGRERLGSTYIGEGIAVPHASLEGLSTPQLIILRFNDPIAYEVNNSGDEHTQVAVDLVCGVLVPEACGTQVKKSVGKLVRLLKDPQTCQKLKQASSRDGVYAVLKQALQRSASGAHKDSLALPTSVAA